MLRGKLFSFINKNQSMLVIFLIGIVFFTILNLVNHRLVGTDDTIFPVQIAPYHTIFDWVYYRYENWSGRFFSEAIIYIFNHLPLAIWRLTNIIFYSLFVLVTYAYFRLFAKNRDRLKDSVMLAIAICLPFLANSSVVADGIVWMTGSMVYFWMATLGLIGLYPVTYYILRNKYPNIFLTIGSFIAIIISSSSQEQVGAVLFAFTFTLFIYGLIKNRKQKKIYIPWYVLIFLIAVSVSFILSVSAPGNAMRLNLELARWLPDFYSVPFLDRLNYSYRWFIDAIVAHTGFLLILTWLTMAVLFISKNKKTFIDYTVMFLLISVSLITLSRGSDGMHYFFEFYAAWKQPITNHLMSLVVLPWGIVLVFTLVAPILLFGRRNIFGYLISVLILATYVSTAIMLLSPTFYASSWRSLLIPSVVLMFVVYMLIDRVIDTFRKQQTVLLMTVMSLSLSNYVYQIMRLIQTK